MATRVLVVEDERNIRVLVASVLRQKGCDVVEASNGQEALNRLRQDPAFDVVLTDLKMPEVNGVKLVTELQKMYPNLPVVIMSAYTTEDWARDITRRSVVALPKPFTHSQLVETLNQVLQRH